MPRSGGRSKKQRTRTRLAAEAALVGHANANFYNDLAPADEGLPAPEPEGEEPSPSPDEPAGSRADEEEPRNSISDNKPQPAEGTASASSLAEDVLAGPSPFPPGDPVRVETAACLRRCILNGTTPPAWVLQKVMLASAGVENGATAA